MTTLVEHLVEAHEIERQIAQSGGELTPEIEQALMLNETSIAAKVDSIQYLEESFEAKANQFRQKADKFKAVANGMDKAAKKLRNHVMSTMIHMGVEELQGKHGRYVLSKCKHRLVLDEAKLSGYYKMQVTTYVADKDAINADLDKGIVIEGANREGGLSLRSYPGVSI